MNSPLDHALALLARARDDGYVVRRLCGEADAPRWVLGFHAQQAVEKALKAVLSAAELEYPRTHNLVMLTQLLHAAGRPVPPDSQAFGQITAYGVVLRYEDAASGDFSQVDAGWLDALASRTLEWAEALLREGDRQR